MTPLEEHFIAVKSAVAAIEFTLDTGELDRRLGQISTMVYDLRCEIDAQWRGLRARAVILRGGGNTSLSDDQLLDLLNLKDPT